jgi:hypothetical protein
MQFKQRYAPLFVLSLLGAPAYAVVIPIDLDVSGYIQTDTNIGFDGNGSVDIAMKAIDNSVETVSTTITGDFSNPSTVGIDPLSISRFQNTNAGFNFDGIFSPDSGVSPSSPFEFHEYAGQFGFDINNQTTDDYLLTWTFSFNLSADAKQSEEYVQTYLQSDVFGDLFRRDLESDGLNGDQITRDDTRPSALSGFGDLLTEIGNASFQNTVAAGSQASFNGSFGIYSETFITDLLLSGGLSFDILLSNVENLTNTTNPPNPTIPEPSSIALILLGLGLINLRKRSK